MVSPLPDPPEHLDPDHFGFVGAQFMAARLLSVAVELGVFEALADGPLTLDELGAKIEIGRRAARVVASGLASLGHLTLAEGRFANGEHAQAFLAGRTSVDLRPGLRLYHHIVYPMWMGFEKTARTGQPGRVGQPSEAFARIFSEGVEAWTAVGARALAQKYDFGAHRRILDVGGGTGSYLIPILEKHPALRGTLYELPPTIEVAKRRLAGEATAERIALVEGDALFDPIPDGHDVVVMAGFIHLFDPAKIVRVLRRVREVVAPGARLLIVDQWMDPTHTRPLLGALLAATYLLVAGDGDTYDLGEAQAWLRETGFRFVEHQGLSTAISLLVAEAV
jgi:ubiquinone/menaquinone biosynthesis C-methylase UbiE